MPATPPQNLFIWHKRILVLLLILLPCSLPAHPKSLQKPVKLSSAEIKEAERLFAIFKKRLERTNDLRIALRGLLNNNWFARVVNSNFAGVDETLPVDQKFLRANFHNQSQRFEKLYLSLLRYDWSLWLYTNFYEDAKDKGESELNSLFSSLPPSMKKFNDQINSSNPNFTSLNQIIRVTYDFNLATNLVNKKLKQLLLKQPALYEKVLLRSNIFTDDKPYVNVCDDLCLGLPKGSEILVQNRLVLLGVFFLSI
jgi:hypothetical protein